MNMKTERKEKRMIDALFNIVAFLMLVAVLLFMVVCVIVLLGVCIYAICVGYYTILDVIKERKGVGE